MRILLINPPSLDGISQIREGRCEQKANIWTTVWPPITLATIAGVLLREGFTVQLKDCGVEPLDFTDIQDIAREFKPRLVVLNTATPSIENDLKTAQYLKKIDLNIRMAIIGVHCSALPDESLKLEESVDFVIRGEPEYTARDLAFRLREGRPNYDDIKGLSYREGAAIRHNEAREAIDPLDDLPYPAWNLIDQKRYLLPFSRRRFLMVATSRGCPHPCMFCASSAYYGKRFRKRSASKIVDEIAWSRERFGIEDFLIWSESFTFDRGFAASVAEEIIRRKTRVRWVCNSRVDDVDLELLKAFKRAGCWMISYGVESGSQDILDLMKKNINLSQIEEAVAAAKRAGLKTVAHSMVGFPGETQTTFKKTIDLVKRLKFDFAQFYCAVPFPGSELYLKKDSGMYDLASTDWRLFEQSSCVIKTKHLSTQEVAELRRKAYREFYIRPRIIWNVLKEMGSRPNLPAWAGAVRGFKDWAE